MDTFFVHECSYEGHEIGSPWVCCWPIEGLLTTLNTIEGVSLYHHLHILDVVISLQVVEYSLTVAVCGDSKRMSGHHAAAMRAARVT